MPAHNFMLDDLSGSLRAIGLFPIFLFIPGYVAAWLFDLFQFRRRTAAFRIAFSVPLSISLCPILTYLLGRFAGMGAVLIFYGALAAAFVALLVFGWKEISSRRLLPPGSAVFAVIACIWMAVSLLSLIDLQIGDRLYYPTSTVDYASRTAFTHSISTTGVPPVNPLYEPGGHRVHLRYHYFWLLMCSLVNQASGGGANARLSMVGGTFWCGVGLMALVLVYLRLFTAGRPDRFRRRALAGILLLAVTGLDIIPTLGFLFLYAKGIVNFVLPSVEWWNEHVDWFTYSTIWAPHAVAATIACFTAFLLLWHAPTEDRRGLLRYSLPAGLALASSVGCSIYVSMVFAIFLSVWTVVTFCKKWFRETVALAIAGAVMILLALPYLRDLTGPAHGGSLLEFGVRAFSLAALIPTPHLNGVWRLILVNGTLLPVNYLLEFGFFFLVARYKWRRHRASGAPLSRQDLALLLMVSVSLLVCTFMRSRIGSNDLGWRGMLVAEFVLLLWAVDIFTERDHLPFLSGHQRDLLIVFVGLGVAGTVCDLALVRLYPVLVDRGVVPALDWMAGDGALGKRTYAARDAYQWLQTVTPATAVVQSTPHVAFQDMLGMIYSERLTVAGDMGCEAAYGGDPAQCPPIVSRLEEIFPASGPSRAPSIADACEALHLDVVVAKDTDAAWADRRGWVWMESPVYRNDYMRLFRCPGRSPVANAGAPVAVLPPH